MTDRNRFAVPVELEGERADKIVATITEATRSEARALVDAGKVLVDGEPARAASRLHAGATVEVGQMPVPPEVVAAPVDFDVAYEDEYVVLVDKPAGLVVHPGAGHNTGTLVNGLVDRYPELGHLGTDRRFGLVHRLDRGTSGLLLVGRTVSSYDTLREALRRREIERVYLVLAAGAFDAATGTIDAAIGRDPARPTRMKVLASGRPARTHYRRLASWADSTLLQVTLETGRTHQVRVHLAAIGHPVLGDRVYGSGKTAEPARPWLHAARLTFSHPHHGNEMIVESLLPIELLRDLEGRGEPDHGEVVGPGIQRDT